MFSTLEELPLVWIHESLSICAALLRPLATATAAARPSLHHAPASVFLDHVQSDFDQLGSVDQLGGLVVGGLVDVRSN